MQGRERHDVSHSAGAQGAAGPGAAGGPGLRRHRAPAHQRRRAAGGRGTAAEFQSPESPRCPGAGGPPDPGAPGCAAAGGGGSQAAAAGGGQRALVAALAAGVGAFRAPSAQQQQQQQQQQQHRTVSSGRSAAAGAAAPELLALGHGAVGAGQAPGTGRAAAGRPAGVHVCECIALSLLAALLFVHFLYCFKPAFTCKAARCTGAARAAAAWRQAGRVPFGALQVGMLRSWVSRDSVGKLRGPLTSRPSQAD
jgi:hypothetical protein